MFAHRGRARCAGVVAAAALAALAGTARAQSPVYRTGFSDGASAGWSTARTFGVRTGNTLLGRFHNESVALSLDGLNRHGSVVVAMDLHLIGRWTGEARAGALATTFSITLDDGTLLSCSLANDDGDPMRRQSFPDEPGAGVTRPAALGAYKLNALGLSDDGGRGVIDSVYRLVFTAPHNAGTLRLNLSAAGLPGSVKDASWAIDNAVVYAVSDGADLEAVRAAARDAVLKTSLGMNGSFAVPSAVPAATGLPSAPATPYWSDEPVGHAAILEGVLRPAAISTQKSILADAMDAESRLGDILTPPQETTLTIGLARELAMLPERRPASDLGLPVFPAAAAAAAPMARVEQPVTRRVSALVYQSRFNEAPGEQWDARAHGTAPHGERFVGPFANTPATLTLGDIPEHDQLIIDADFYTIGDWRGDAKDPSRFTILLDGQRLLGETFANEDGDYKRTQSYPSGGKAHLPGSGSASLDALGYTARNKNAVGDACYHLRFVVPHANASAALKFAASGLREGAAWGVDNITIVSGGNRSMSYSDATGLEPDDNADDGDYMNPFVRPPGDEWNVKNLEKSPSGEMFLGPLQNQTAALTVKNFPVHTHLVVAADVMVMGDWQGNTLDPSRFGIKLSDGTVVLATSFATDGGAIDATQDYPGGSNGRNLPGAGAASVGSLGYKDPATGVNRDAVYRLIFTLPHTAAQETVSFTVTGLHGDSSKAAWGLDNVSVSTFDSANPTAGGGTSLGDAGALALGNPSGGTIGGYPQGDPLGNNPFIPPTSPGDPFPHGPGGPTDPEPPNPPIAPAPGTMPALLVGAMVAMRRNRRA